jgi:hypothetical protein
MWLDDLVSATTLNDLAFPSSLFHFKAVNNLIMSPPVPRTAPPSLEELERTLGVLFIGFLVCIILYGFTFFRACAVAFQSSKSMTNF